MKWKTWANLVTAVGFVFVAFYVWAYLTSRGALVLTFLVVAGLSDLFDGYLARRFNQVTLLGTYIDPIHDRLLMIAIMGNFLVIYPAKEILGFLIVISIFEIGMVLVNAVRGFPQPVHILAKVRYGIHTGGAFLIIASRYIHPFLVHGAHETIFTTMAFASGVALVGYLFFQTKNPCPYR